jgi:hypothetical protein
MEKIAKENYPQIELLKQVKGVGTQIALTYVLTLPHLPIFSNHEPHDKRKAQGERVIPPDLTCYGICKALWRSVACFNLWSERLSGC